jgi:hypothetical protein
MQSLAQVMDLRNVAALVIAAIFELIPSLLFNRCAWFPRGFAAFEGSAGAGGVPHSRLPR